MYREPFVPGFCPGSISPRLVGLGGLSPMLRRTLLRRALENGDIFQGYAGRYRYVCFDEVEMSFGLVPASADETPGTASRLAGVDFNVRSPTTVSFLPEEELREIRTDSPLSRCVYLRPAAGVRRPPVPVRIMHSDVLPGIAFGDCLNLQTVLLADRARYFPSRPTVRGKEEYEPVLLKETPGAAPGGAVPEETVTVCGRVEDVYIQRPGEQDIRLDEAFVHVIIETACGYLTVIHPLSLLSEGVRRHLSPGCGGFFRGILSGDAAVGEYRNGAVFDLPHDFRLFADCHRRRNFDRAKSIFAEEARLYDGTRLVAEGRDRIIGELNARARALVRRGEDMGIVYGEVLPVEGRRSSRENGEKCLLLQTPGRDLHSALYARVDGEGKILILRQEHEHVCAFRHSPWFEEWRTGFQTLPAEPEAAEEAAQEDLPGDPPEMSGVEGDPARFAGTPSEDLGDVLREGLNLPGSALRRRLEFSVLSGESTLLDEAGRIIASAQVFPPDAEARLLFLLSPDSGGVTMRLRSALPLLPGRVNRLRIEAVRAWKDRLNGEAAARLFPDGPEITFHCPFFYRDREALRPGSIVDISLYAVALELRREERKIRVLRKDGGSDLRPQPLPLPGTEDFPPRAVSTGDLVISGPLAATSRMLVQTAIREVSKTGFPGVEFRTLLAPIARAEADRGAEITACIHVREGLLKGFTPRPGDLISCRLWLAGVPAGKP